MIANSEHLIRVDVRNTSRSSWQHDAANGWVAVSYHWQDAARQTVIRDGQRTRLPNDVQPGEQLTLPHVKVAAPDKPGRYRLEMSLVREGVAWFEMQGADSFTANVTVY